MSPSGDGRAAPATFSQATRREQIIDCTIDAIVQVGLQRTSVGEVARRAGVSKGVVTYYFAAKDDLIFAVVAHVFDSVQASLKSHLLGLAPGRFVAEYITTWVEYYRTNTRHMLALGEIWSGFRDESGRQRFGAQAVEGELDAVRQMLERGQADGSLGTFSARVMAVSMKAALNALLAQLATDPELDLETYRTELVALFERASRPQP